MTNASPILSLAQLVAAEKHTKSTANAITTRSHALLQQGDVLYGVRKTYEPEAADGVQLPPVNTRVRVSTADVLREVSDALARLMDVTATRDWGNCDLSARADVALRDGTVLITQAPVPFLLWLEKNIGLWRTFVEKLPVLDDSEEWKRGESGLYETEPVEQAHIEEVPQSHVLYEATEHHPAQVHFFTKEVLLGRWRITQQSGALPGNRVRDMLQRFDELTEAVKIARERANSAEVERKELGTKVFGYLFGE